MNDMNKRPPYQPLGAILRHLRERNRESVAEVSGAPPGKTAPSDSRVKVIILPPKKDADADKKAASPGMTLKADPGAQ